jgi:hypothetical protein
MVGLVVIRAQHTAKIRAKSLILSEKNYYIIIAHLCSEMEVFAENPTFRHDVPVQYSRTKHAVYSYLRNQTTAQTENLMGSTVNNISKF